VKRASKKVIERYYQRLTLDFAINKRICDEVAMIPSKRLRNKIAGFTTHLMKRIQTGPVRGISLRLQEEERERKMDFIPERSQIQVENIKTGDKVLYALIKELGVTKLVPKRPQAGQRNPRRQ